MMRLLLLTLFLGLLTSCLTACELAREKPTADKAILGKLLDIRSLEVFLDKELKSPIANKPSHALVIGNSQPCRLLLVDGRLGWADQPSLTESRLTQITLAAPIPGARLSASPIHPESGDASVSVNHSLDASSRIVAAGEQRFSETPHYILEQGRRIFLDDPQGFFYWPLLKLQDQTASGWTPATGLAFRPADHQPLRITGLIQKPFVTLQTADAAPTFTVAESFTYLDITDAKTTSLNLDQQPRWNLQQVLVPSPELATAISSITLASSTNNCNMVFVEWRRHEKMQFGYCKHKEAAPTPLIVGYRPDADSPYLSLDILEIMGDEDRLIRVQVANQFKGHGSILVESR